MLKNKYLIYGLILVFAVVFPFVMRTAFLRDLLVMTLIFAMLTLSLDLIVTGMGQFSFGHQAFFALGAYTAGILSLKLGVPPFIGMLVAGAAGGISGYLVGLVALRRTRGVYLAIVTLGVSVILSQVFSYSGFRGITGGNVGLSGIPSMVLPGGMIIKSDLSYYFFVLVIVLIIIYVINSWKRSRFGRAAASLRDNEVLASSTGISPYKIYTMTFAMSTAIAGLAGGLYTYYLNFVSPPIFGAAYMSKILVMLFVGGVGTIGGPFLGSFVFTFVPKWLPSQEIGLVFFGIILVVCILFMPNGLLPALISLFKNFVRRLSKRRDAKTVLRQS
jgi:branched-chain amino acid transport system permease protein